MNNKYEIYDIIELSDYDKTYCSDYVTYNGPQDDDYGFIYSKIIIKFGDVDEYFRFLELDIDLNTFTLCWDWDDFLNAFILYSLEKAAFSDICDKVKDFECDVFQYIFGCLTDIRKEKLKRINEFSKKYRKEYYP